MRFCKDKVNDERSKDIRSSRYVKLKLITELNSRDILQIDATVITGVLILLTISFVSEDGTQQKGNEIFKIAWTLGIIIPFAVSAILATNEILSTKPEPKNFRLAIVVLRVGFYYIIIGIVGIGILQILLILSS